ncbi:hypothetical protein FRC02_010589 [Tulasnella sp. 418]|nr:hypothetical protein FRC02_010589 [Tulasnella sp. 418]
MAPLVPNLTFASRDGQSTRCDLPPPGQLLFITDALASRGDFMIYSALVNHFKNPKPGRAVIVTSRDVQHWRAISLKVNLNLNAHLASEKLKFVSPSVDDLFLSNSPPNQDGCPVVNLFHTLKTTFASNGETEREGNALIILDDLAMFEWIGIEQVKLVRFLRALRALAREFNASVIILYHQLDNSLNDVVQYLLSWAQCHLRISSLTSGLSGAVSGEIWWQVGMAANDPDFVTRPKAQALHYKLLESGPTYFERGTGGGVL